MRHATWDEDFAAINSKALFALELLLEELFKASALDKSLHDGHACALVESREGLLESRAPPIDLLGILDVGEFGTNVVAVHILQTLDNFAELEVGW